MPTIPDSFPVQPTQSDPKLKEASAEIEEVLKKYGVAGFICLASSSHSEFNLFFPPWSCVQIHEDERGKGLRIKAKHTEKDRAYASIDTVVSLRDMAGLMFQNLQACCQQLEQYFEIKYQPFSGLWDMDGWQQPNLPAAKHRVIDLKNKPPKRSQQKGKKGFKNP